jgi:energy-coupling factor transporter ATP-binding protein EcfA2
MDAASLIDAFKLPTEPYPGLRPFLDHEAALLLGRSHQVREVIERLRETQFVAVIGGSGSGKSSLIRAGVVPELRGFGLPDAGDYWVPVVCTPGTTFTPADHASSAGDAAPLVAQTPITRLAWKFSQQLDPADEVLKRRLAADGAAPPAEPVDPLLEAAHRRAEIATVFRQSGGFARLVNAYCDELPARGPAREDARFLFVIDQFEELFHPNNHDSADAKALIEAVIDHFFNPHPRCYVILTMRSEHLADCAGFLELPDAINKSSYLVRRLDDAELREAIIGPAKYFLRLCQRGAAAGSTLPDDIAFDEAVVRRLLADVARITGDADHLPLLQHVLARIWEAACVREGADGARQLPTQILWGDLERAVAPRSPHPPGWLVAQEAVNALRSSLENWAESVYLDRSPERRVLLDTVLRQLAFKDPNNGQYSQQRIDVDDPRLFPGVAQPRELLHELLAHGYLDSVNYLFWDKENPDRVTLKVSHESFIRGWAHFRVLVDAEADRFDEFVGVLRKCALWSADERPELLLEASELARFAGAGLEPVFENHAERVGWFRVLKQYRDGERLSKTESRVDEFLATSRARR